MSKLTIVADSTQLATFLECPRLWQYSFGENLTAVSAPPNEPMLKGTYGHKLLDIYYKAKAEGLDITNAIDKALAWNPDNDLCKCGHSIEGHIQNPKLKLIPSRVCQVCQCEEIEATPYPLDAVMRNEVSQRFREYCYTYINNDIVPESVDHVEVGFSEPIYESALRLYVLEGRIDLMGTLQGLKCAVDHKFQMRSHKLYHKSIQFRNYAMVTKTNMFVINYIRLSKQVTKDTFVRDIACFTPIEHNVWRQRIIRVFDQMAEAQEHEVYEQKWEACSGKYGYPCNFTPLCEKWDRDLIQLTKNTQYVQKQEWKPW